MAQAHSHDTTLAVSAPGGQNSPISFTQPGISGTGEVHLVAPGIGAHAETILRGTPGESVTGWKFGFIQLKFVSTDWAYYRGRTNAEGSCFIALDRPPARPSQLCRDRNPITRNTSLFYDLEAVGAPVAAGRRTLVLGATTIPPNGQLAIAVDFGDRPSRHYSLIAENTSFAPAPAKTNYLHEVQLEAAFATIFAALDPAGAFHALKHFYWNISGQPRFHRDAAGMFSTSGHHGVHLNIQHHVHSGMPQDPRFAGRASDNSLPICVPVIRTASSHPAKRCARVWSNFDVRHPLR